MFLPNNNPTQTDQPSPTSSTTSQQSLGCTQCKSVIHTDTTDRSQHKKLTSSRLRSIWMTHLPEGRAPRQINASSATGTIWELIHHLIWNSETPMTNSLMMNQFHLLPQIHLHLLHQITTKNSQTPTIKTIFRPDTERIEIIHSLTIFLSNKKKLIPSQGSILNFLKVYVWFSIFWLNF